MGHLLVTSKPRLVFISPRFLFPNDSGGKIRTTQILRGMKGGRFDITLVSPALPGVEDRFEEELESVADHFFYWPESEPKTWLDRILRYRHLLSRLPFPVATDRTKTGEVLINQLLEKKPDLVIFDFLHAAVFAPSRIYCHSLLFTHNVETEIFKRHAEVVSNPLMKMVWQSQYQKMHRFEMESIPLFDTVVAVSERDGDVFKKTSGKHRTEVISTGVDLDYFSYRPPNGEPRVVFTGSMDWLANIDGIRYFMPEVWPLIERAAPNASMTVVGRNPPQSLIDQAQEKGFSWDFTGFVDDVRPHVWEAAAYIVPLRVGGGTRIKVFEAMAMGIPVVSTGLGVEGLSIEAGKHYMRAETAEEMAEAVVKLLSAPDLARQYAERARQYVEDHCSSCAVARQFEDICWRTLYPEQEHAL